MLNISSFHFNHRKNPSESMIKLDKNIDLVSFEDSMKLIRGKESNKKICICDKNYVYFNKNDILLKIKTLIYEKIRKKIKNNISDEDVNEILKRIMISNHVNEKNLDRIKDVKKIIKGIDSIEAFGSAPQVYKDELQYVKGEDVKNLVKFFISDAELSFNIASKKLLQALLIKQNPQMLAEVIDELQRVSQKMVDEINSKESLSPHEHMLTEMLVGNILAIIPFMEPENGKVISVPQFLNDKWQMVQYKVKRHALTPPEMGKPLLAYGMTPCNLKISAPPLLLFMGTPPPTTTGVALAAWVDLAPGYAVGEIAYEYAEDKLVKWMETANLKCRGQKVQLYGQSLGGSLSLICACSHPELIGKVFAYNPPAPTEELLERYRERSKSLEKLPEINVYAQQNDPVSYLGKGWSQDWNVHRVIPKNTNPSGYLAHIQAFSGQKKVLVHKVDVLKDASSKKRRILNKIFNVAKVPIFRMKTFRIKITMMARNHSFASFKAKVHEIGIGNLFQVIFSVPNKDAKIPFIQTLLNEA